MNYKTFGEFRHKDYVIPRSMNEAYGRDVKLYVEEEASPNRRWFVLMLVGVAWIAYGVLTTVL